MASRNLEAHDARVRTSPKTRFPLIEIQIRSRGDVTCFRCPVLSEQAGALFCSAHAARSADAAARRPAVVSASLTMALHRNPSGAWCSGKVEHGAAPQWQRADVVNVLVMSRAQECNGQPVLPPVVGMVGVVDRPLAANDFTPIRALEPSALHSLAHTLACTMTLGVLASRAQHACRTFEASGFGPTLCPLPLNTLVASLPVALAHLLTADFDVGVVTVPVCRVNAGPATAATMSGGFVAFDAQ